MMRTSARMTVGTLAIVIGLSHSALAFGPRAGGGGARGGRLGSGGVGGSPIQGGSQGGRFGSLFENRGESGGADASNGRFAPRSQTSGSRYQGSAETLGDTDGRTYDTRGGGSVDTNKTTDGDTTSRDTTYTGANGQSASHSGSVTKGDGSFDYSGSSSTGAGGSSHSSASGTYNNGQVTSMTTSISGQNAAGQTADHDGNWNRNGDTVNYYGSSWTSTGKSSNAAATVTKTDDGFVAHGVAVTNQGAAAGTVVKDGDDVYGRSVATNGETVNRNWTNCTGANCTRTTVTTNVQQYYVSPYYYHPAYYAYYACPAGSMTVFTGAGGTAVYGCSVTPVTAMTIPLTAAMLASKKQGQQTSTQVTSSPVLMYKVASDTVVYATTYTPEGMYWEKTGSYYYWVPGAAVMTTDVKQAIGRAMHQKAPTANATVITYTIGSSLVYLTNEAPIGGIYSQRADTLYVWIAGVTAPTTSQRDSIATAVSAHENGGAQALAGQVQQLQADKPPPS